MNGVNLEAIRSQPIDRSVRMVNTDKFINRIRPDREALGISRFKASAFCGVSETTFYKLECGVTKRIRQSFYDKLAEMLDWPDGLDE